ncbi:hypothetical protein ACTHGU_18750 [Chitinophagaceae bacterium MMS25-I14]
MINLVLQSFGRENEYRRAVLTILSFYAHISIPAAETNVLLFTDNPDWFEPYFSGLTVTYVQLTPEKIKQMRGRIDFLHRMKIALIEETFQTVKGNILYADSDTFFISDPVPVMGTLTSGKSFMHVWEYKFEYLNTIPLPGGATFQAFVKLIENNSFKLADGSSIKIDSGYSSWNAGVMLFHESHKAFLPDVYALTDQFYPPTSNHASEQYAFSVILQTRTDLQPCDDIVYHYWYRVKKQIIDTFLSKRINNEFRKSSSSRKQEIVMEWIKMLPDYFDNHVFTMKDNAVQAFNENKFTEAYKWVGKSLFKGAVKDTTFMRDVLYHTKRWITRK